MSETPYLYELIIFVIAFLVGYEFSNKNNEKSWARKRDKLAEQLYYKSKYEMDVNKNIDKSEVYKELADNIRFIN